MSKKLDIHMIPIKGGLEFRIPLTKRQVNLSVMEGYVRDALSSKELREVWEVTHVNREKYLRMLSKNYTDIEVTISMSKYGLPFNCGIDVLAGPSFSVNVRIPRRTSIKKPANTFSEEVGVGIDAYDLFTGKENVYKSIINGINELITDRYLSQGRTAMMSDNYPSVGRDNNRELSFKVDAFAGTPMNKYWEHSAELCNSGSGNMIRIYWLRKRHQTSAEIENYRSIHRAR